MEKNAMIVAVVAVVVIAAAGIAAFFIMNNGGDSGKLTIYLEDSTDDFHTDFSGSGDTKIDAAINAFDKAGIEYKVNKETGWVDSINGKGTVVGEDTYTYWIFFLWDKTMHKWVVSETTITGVAKDINIVCYYYGTTDSTGEPLSYPKYSPDGLTYDDTLLVMGNANEDNTIDKKDKEIIQDIIDGKKTLKAYPMADANTDGKVDSKDIELVDKIINKSSSYVYVLNQLDAEDLANAGELDFTYAQVPYPLKNTVVINADLIVTMMVLDGKKAMAGYGGSTYGLEKDYVSGLVDVKASRLVDETAYKNIKNLDSELESQGGIGSLILYNVNSVTSKGYADDLMDAGIPMMILKCSMPDYVGNSLVTLGYLFGGDYEKRGLDISNFVADMYKEINDKLAGATYVKVSALSMNTSLADSSSQYMKVGRMAGGIAVYAKEGTGSESMSGPEVLMNLNPAAITSFTTKGFLQLTDEQIVTTYECKNFNYITPCKAYKDGKLTYFNASLPSMIRVAYAAEVLHPDLFSGFGDKMFQKLVDDFMPFLNDLADDGDFDVSKDCFTFITHDMYVAAGGTQ